MSLSDVIKAALDQINYIAKTETVIGEPIHAGEVTLIPVSRVSIGFAAGGAGNEGKTGSGAGTGGGVTITPVAFVSIVNDKIQVHPMEKNDPSLSKILSMAPDLIKQASKFMGKKSAKEKDGQGE